MPISFWFNGFLGYLISTIAVVLIGASSALRTDFSPIASLATLLGAWTVTFAVVCWQIVGAWRSATEFSNRTAKRFWPAVAKLSLCVAAASTSVQFARRGAPQIQEMYNIYYGDNEVGSHSFRVLRDGAELEFSGGITFGTAKEFARFIDAMGALRVVHLNSLGGRIEEAQRIGNLVKKRNLDTYVARSCLSACTIIFLSGRNRFITNDAKIGFHQPNFAGLSDAERTSLARKEQLRLEGFGLTPSFARRANQVPPNDMWIPSTRELLDERVATRVVNSSTFAVSGLDGAEITTEKTDEILRGTPIYAAIARADASAYREIVDNVSEGFRRGKSAADMMTEVTPIVDKVFEKALPRTAPAVLIEYTEMTIRHLKLLNRESSAACHAYLNPHQNGAAAQLTAVSAKFPSILDDQKSIKEKVFNSYATSASNGASEEDTNATIANVFSSLERRLGKDIDLISKKNLRETEFYPYCNAVIAFYEQVIRLPSNSRVAVLRTLFQ